MTEVLERALNDGGYGFSSSQLDVHADHEGRPVPSNLAAADELVALSDVLSRYPGSVIEFTPQHVAPGLLRRRSRSWCTTWRVRRPRRSTST